MKKLGMILALTACAAFAGEWTGYISESKCGAKHSDGSEASINCVKGCIKGGAQPVFVADGKVIKLANPDKVGEAHYGKKVKVTGEVKGEQLTIATIAAAN